ncbi:MAG: 30S ribosomal protein S3 [Methanothrix sp.]|uniref:Small ribosomal subunit protein uS3 n=1 Tax=Methanothrix thermoacetophila (strain DSM 6194 / JCM 14653 / NBRC 101360 / PT) TaxID=349307 RepID=RS3_METTP|nr:MULTISPECIES: 30S ribosomal protein S3 [Methanothrix]A0B9W4.1 RecName: Full=Small ribosomal subunit protein uS3; AltName: Full=30S ribosomal protein S3 [Methanothrix thermoacetophila PT]ABK15488.1 SSU ribosomal protein S3P [Methanothrix thermoacetophila PT]MBC7080034.1 30S ribosomal protein S3 [Methanothrix sp.]NPU88184.1 30S ribosomal protein S3 [Methanothrix sp.]
MAVEKKFVQEGFTKALVDEYLAKELDRAGYGGMVMNRTPMGTQITVYAEKPGMVIGKGGKLIRKLTRDLERRFRLDNPQIDVQDVGKSDLNARVVANRLASSLEHGWYFRKAGQSMLRRVMDSGALGCEIVISGKLTGPRSRVEKFLAGYIKHSGKPAEEIVDTGYAVAVKKLGAIGCQVRIVPPGAVLPDDFQINAPPKEPEKEPVVEEAVLEAEPSQAAETQEQQAGEKKSELDRLLDEPVETPPTTEEGQSPQEPESRTEMSEAETHGDIQDR